MKKKMFLKCIFALTVAAVLSSCDKSNSDTTSPEQPGELTTTKTAQEKVKSGVFDFSFDIFREAAKTSGAKSFMISPLSLATALAMTEGGAAGATAEEMKAVLGFPGATQDDFAAYFKDISKQIREADSSVEVKVANSIWSDTGFPVLDVFKEFSEYYYDAAIRTRNFQSPSTADEINAWCADKTNGKIPSITSAEEMSSLCMCLINALYFNAKWTKEFDGGLSHVFYESGTKAQAVQNPLTVPMITIEGQSQPYAKDSDFTFVEIPYGNGSFVFDVLLPKEDTDIYESIKLLTGKKFNGIAANARATKMNFTMPEFKLEFTAEKLIDNLKTLGMNRAFGNADFSKISHARINISLINHKTFIGVSQKGTEAAAATMIGMRETSVGGQILSITLDRPYIFAIREINTGAILFIGAIISLDGNGKAV